MNIFLTVIFVIFALGIIAIVKIGEGVLELGKKLVRAFLNLFK